MLQTKFNTEHTQQFCLLQTKLNTEDTQLFCLLQAKFSTEIHGSSAYYRLSLTQKYTRNNATRHAKADLEAETKNTRCLYDTPDRKEKKLARERRGKNGGRGGERGKGIKT